MIQLRPLFKHDAVFYGFCEWRNDVRIRPYLRTAFDNYPDTQFDWVEDIIRRNDCYYYFIYFQNDQEKQKVVGYCGLDNIHWQSKHAEISILLSPDELRKGYGKSAVKLLLEKAFVQLNINLVYADVYSHNPARGFWEDMGFKHEGILRDRKYWNDEYHNSLMLSIRKGEFLK